MALKVPNNQGVRQFRTRLETPGLDEVPSGQGAAFMKQFAERGLDKSGIKLIATGDVTDDDQLNDMGDVALGVVSSHHYSAAHPSAANKKFVAAFEKAKRVFGDQDLVVLPTAAGSLLAHAERHSLSFNRLRRSQVRIVFSGTLWRVASSS